MPFEKLVRDKIPSIMRAKGVEPVLRSATGEELKGFIHAKLQEELDELLAAQSIDDIAGEAGDLLEILKAKCAAHGISFEDVLQLMHRKFDERGGFEKGFILLMEKPGLGAVREKKA